MQSSTSINAGSKHPICDYHDGALKAAWEKSIRLCSSRAKPHTIPREALEEALEKGRAGRDWCRSCRGRLTWKLGQIHHEWKEGKWFIKLVRQLLNAPDAGTALTLLPAQ